MAMITALKYTPVAIQGLSHVISLNHTSCELFQYKHAETGQMAFLRMQNQDSQIQALLQPCDVQRNGDQHPPFTFTIPFKFL